MPATPLPPFAWVRLPDGRYADASGRFDVMRVAGTEQWKALDWDTGRGVRGELAACKRWCEAKAANKQREAQR